MAGVLSGYILSCLFEIECFWISDPYHLSGLEVTLFTSTCGQSLYSKPCFCHWFPKPDSRWLGIFVADMNYSRCLGGEPSLCHLDCEGQSKPEAHVPATLARGHRDDNAFDL